MNDIAQPTVLYDACVLHPPLLRDLLMQLGMTDLFRARWTDDIHEEWIRSVLKSRSDITREQLDRVRALMDAHVPHCLVTDYHYLVPTIHLPDPDDRHVLAAAIHGKADVILTKNLKHFPAAVLNQFGIEPQHPDEFCVRLVDQDQGAVCAAACKCRARMRKPPKSVTEYLGDLERQGLPQTVARLREFTELI